MRSGAAEKAGDCDSGREAEGMACWLQMREQAERHLQGMQSEAASNIEQLQSAASALQVSLLLFDVLRPLERGANCHLADMSASLHHAARRDSWVKRWSALTA